MGIIKHGAFPNKIKKKTNYALLRLLALRKDLLSVLTLFHSLFYAFPVQCTSIAATTAYIIDSVVHGRVSWVGNSPYFIHIFPFKLGPYN